jgi:hypothetical protein
MAQGKREKMMESRLEIVSDLYKRAYSYREIRNEAISRLGIKSYSLSTVKEDIERLLALWRERELSDTDKYIKLELARIDDAVREMWEQWEKSKQNYIKTSSRKKGAPDKKDDKNTIKTYQKEETETEVIRLGDVSYISEIRAQLIERRKLIGLYAPERKDVTINEFDLSKLTPEQRNVLLEVGERVLSENE